MACARGGGERRAGGPDYRHGDPWHCERNGKFWRTLEHGWDDDHELYGDIQPWGHHGDGHRFADYSVGTYQRHALHFYGDGDQQRGDRDCVCGL